MSFIGSPSSPVRFAKGTMFYATFGLLEDFQEYHPRDLIGWSVRTELLDPEGAPIDAVDAVIVDPALGLAVSWQTGGLVSGIHSWNVIITSPGGDEFQLLENPMLISLEA
jgi:hypothetical protein